MRILVACEFSGIVRDAFRARGHDAWSCDLLPCDADPQYHIQGDVLPVLKQEWDLMVAHPPCTHIAVSGAAWFEEKRSDGRQQEGIDFFLEFTKTDIPKWCVENPVSIMSTLYRRPDQVVQPYYFGDPYTKTTCLWLNRLPRLLHTDEDNLFMKKTHVDKGEFVTFKSGKRMPKWYAELRTNKDRGKIRSQFWPGIADAMADQWGSS